MGCFHVNGYNRRGGHVKGYKRCVKGAKAKVKRHRRHRRKR